MPEQVCVSFILI